MAARRKHNLGYSIYQLLIALLIGSILMGLATANWQSTIARWSIRRATHQLVTALSLARRTALSTGEVVTVCATSDFETCQPQAEHWMVFRNAMSTRPGLRDPTEPLIHSWGTPPQVLIQSSRNLFFYYPELRAATTQTWSLCANRPAREGYQGGMRVIVSQTGRVRLEDFTRDSSMRGCVS